MRIFEVGLNLFYIAVSLGAYGGRRVEHGCWNRIDSIDLYVSIFVLHLEGLHRQNWYCSFVGGVPQG